MESGMAENDLREKNVRTARFLTGFIVLLAVASLIFGIIY